MLVICGGMTPSNLVNYKVIYNKKQKDLVSSILYDENSVILKYRKSNKGELKRYIKLCHIKIKIIELVKTLFYITHQKKYPFIISPYSNYYSIFDFNIHKDHNLYRNLWNFYQMKIKENYNLKFSDAKGVYFQKLNEIEMNKAVSDILFSRVNEAEIISFQKTKNLQEAIEKYEKEILNSFSASELIQVIKNKLIFLGVDLSKLSLNNIKTPLAFSEFIRTISKYRVGLKN
jgi:NADH dehydrogenase/NADH:ubiquinone oxidoreductase subunit G